LKGCRWGIEGARAWELARISLLAFGDGCGEVESSDRAGWVCVKLGSLRALSGHSLGIDRLAAWGVRDGMVECEECDVVSTAEDYTGANRDCFVRKMIFRFNCDTMNDMT